MNQATDIEYSWDPGITHFSPAWGEISGKAHHYKTARLRSNGTYVGIVGVTRYQDGLELVEPLFVLAGGNRVATEDLCGFVL